MQDWKNYLEKYSLSEGLKDEKAAFRACELALRAAELGSFGVGAVLLDDKRNVIVEGHSEVFLNGFRSDLHAEMVVMNKFEIEHREFEKLGSYTLITSLEPCPMCMARLILASVGTISHVGADEDGGMVHRKSSLPPIFQNLIRNQSQMWGPAECSKELREAAFHISDQTRLQLENRIVSRGNRRTG